MPDGSTRGDTRRSPSLFEIMTDSYQSRHENPCTSRRGADAVPSQSCTPPRVDQPTDGVDLTNAD